MLFQASYTPQYPQKNDVPEFALLWRVLFVPEEQELAEPYLECRIRVIFFFDHIEDIPQTEQAIKEYEDEAFSSISEEINNILNAMHRPLIDIPRKDDE